MEDNKGKQKKEKLHWVGVTTVLIIYDAVVIFAAYFLALWFRFDCRFSLIPLEYLSGYSISIAVYAAFCIAVFYIMHLYNSIWRFASFTELLHVSAATALTGILYAAVQTAFVCRMPISYFVFGITLQFIMTLGIRFAYRFVLLLRSSRKLSGTELNVMLIGAGEAGQMILRDIRHAREVSEKVCCFIDDNKNKWNRYIDGVPVYGGRDSILEAVEKYNIDKIYVTMPSSSPKDKRDILNICNATNCQVLSLPGMYQLYTGEVTVSRMKPVQIEDLLGRKPIRTDMQEVFEYITGKTVLITGVGSIGSELARQVASHRPKQLILFDIYENNAYDIQQELRKKYPELKLETLIGSVRDSRRIFGVFEKYRPEIVYHAAAHKHVPLMEDSPCESIKNNVIGTYKTAFAAMCHGCRRFVLISTDKAVNPTNIMGASKRICEMVIQAFDTMIKSGRAEELPQLFTHKIMKSTVTAPEVMEAIRRSQTEFVAVRFGNVLGSNGSVIPLFKKQIEAGGPVTVTHPDIIRYFMTIPEAVSLVMLAGTYARGGEIFVLDMGEPVKIVTLARNLIRQSGYRPDVDIKIEYCGLRLGEKLYEEKLMAEEGLKRTDNDLIHIGCPIPFDVDIFLKQLERLMETAYMNHEGDIRQCVMQIVNTYHPEGHEDDREQMSEKTAGMAV